MPFTSQHLKAFRKHFNISQDYAAGIFRISVPTWRRLENGGHEVPAVLAERIQAYVAAHKSRAVVNDIDTSTALFLVSAFALDDNSETTFPYRRAPIDRDDLEIFLGSRWHDIGRHNRIAITAHAALKSPLLAAVSNDRRLTGYLLPTIPNVKRFREAAGLISMARLGRLARRTEKTVWRYENNKTTIPLDFLLRATLGWHEEQAQKGQD